MDFKPRPLADLQPHDGALDTKLSIIGFEDFVDTIVTPADLRAFLATWK